MVAYTSAFLAAANLLAFAHAAPAQPVCQAVITVITGSPIWVPRADPTTSAGWGAWPPKGTTTSAPKSSKTTVTWSVSLSTVSTSSGGGFYPVTSSTSSWTYSTSTATTPTTITFTAPSDVSTTVTPTTSTIVVTPTPSTTTVAPPAPTCAATGNDVFSTSASGSCGCEFTVNCNMHAPYGADTKFWERTDGEIINSLAECQSICNDNSACTAAIWVNRDGAPSNEYLRCWQTSGLPQPNEDAYGQLSYKGACSSSCSQSYSTTG